MRLYCACSGLGNRTGEARLKERIQKILSERGVCSRRAAEKLISGGRVSVNGRTASLGDGADAVADEILLDGRPIPIAPQKIYVMLNKPRGYVTTASDDRGRRTAAGLVSGCGGRVYPVGRLDMDSEGLLLLTNDGELTNALTHPRNEVEKVYEALVSGDAAAALPRLRTMTELEGERICPPDAEISGREGGGTVLTVTIHEGKNRQVRRMCSACGLSVLRLRRVREGTLSLGGLPSGKWRFLNPDEVLSLKKEADIAD